MSASRRCSLEAFCAARICGERLSACVHVGVEVTSNSRMRLVQLAAGAHRHLGTGVKLLVGAV